MENILTYLNNAGTNVANGNNGESVKIIYRNSDYYQGTTYYALIGLINNTTVNYYTSYGVCSTGHENDNLHIYREPKFGYINIYKSSNGAGRTVDTKIFDSYSYAVNYKETRPEAIRKLYCTTLRVDWKEDM